MPTLKVFFSYSRSDGEVFATRLANDLRKTGVKVWVDKQDIPLGKAWDIEIEEAINSCDCVIFIATEKSVSSQNALSEVSYALEENKPIIPLIFSPCRIPFRIRRFQHLDFTKDYNAPFVALKDYLLLIEKQIPSPGGAVKEPIKPAIHKTAHSTKSKWNHLYRYVFLNFLLTQVVCGIYGAFNAFGIGVLFVSSIIPFTIFFLLLKHIKSTNILRLKALSALVFILIPLTAYTIVIAGSTYTSPFSELWISALKHWRFDTFINSFLPFFMSFFFALVLKIKNPVNVPDTFRQLILPFFLSMFFCTLWYSDNFEPPFPGALIFKIISYLGFCGEVIFLPFLTYGLVAEYLLKKYDNFKVQSVALAIFLVNLLVLHFQSEEYRLLQITTFVLILVPPLLIILVEMIGQFYVRKSVPVGD